MHYDIQIQVQVAMYSYVVELYQKQGQLNIAVVEDGELCVIIVGTTKMLLWFVDSWDSQPQVYYIDLYTHQHKLHSPQFNNIIIHTQMLLYITTHTLEPILFHRAFISTALEMSLCFLAVHLCNYHHHVVVMMSLVCTVKEM